MTAATQELPGGQVPDAGVEFPPVKTVEELDRHVEATYGPEVLRALKDSTIGQGDVLEQLHEQGLNGRAERVQELYRLHEQEFGRKETLLGSAWDTTKEVVSAPFRWTYEAFKTHPIMTTTAVGALALGGVGAYLYSAGALESWLTGAGAGNIAEFFTGAAEEHAPLTPDLPIVPGAGEAGLPGAAPSLPVEPPTFGA